MPRSPADYRYTLNKKVRRLAMKSAFSAKVKENDMIVLDALPLESFQTKTVAAMLSAVGAEKKALIVLAENDEKVD